MTVLEQETVPASLAGLLTVEQRQSISEAPREKRLEVLASALARPESEVLTKLAAAANLGVDRNLETDTDARRHLPPRYELDYDIVANHCTCAGEGEYGS